jgi:D-alanyl-D-alanine carboxypeptidase
MVLEKATGRSLAEQLRKGIVEPLGLQHTTLAPADPTSPELHGYGVSRTDGMLVDVTDDLTFFGNGGSGGIISTADELLSILLAIPSDRLLPAELSTEMTTPNRESYGLGVATYQLSCGTYLGHEGGVNGTASIGIVSPSGDAGVVIVLNLRSSDDPRLPALADQVLCGLTRRAGTDTAWRRVE